MLRSNSKKARENIREYIMQDADILEEYEITPGTEKETIASMYGIFLDEMQYTISNYRGRASEYDIFKSWAQGLALGGLFCYYYNRSAVDDLGDILEETPEERAKYSEQEAEEMLTKLIYREMRNSLPY